MRSTLLIALLVPVVALAASKLQPVTVLPDEARDLAAEPVSRGKADPTESIVLIGTVDTVGGTTYDWASNACSYRMMVNAPDNGVHIIWMFSASDQTTFPDRNMRYNFYQYSSSSWTWIDPDFMASGVNVFTDRCGYGSLDQLPATQVAVLSCHTGDPLHPEVARDMAPGAGIFEYCSGVPNADAHLWPPIATDSSGQIHCALIDDASRNSLFYATVDPWCTWSSPVGVCSPQPNPDFSDQGIASSKVSEKVCITWEYNAATPPDPGYYRESTDGGATWGAPTELPYPPNAYGGDTLTTYHITSFFPFYDSDDELHIAALIGPVVDGGGLIIPAQIWHWSPDNTPNWSHIITATCDTLNLMAGVGYNALYAARPCLGEDSQGNLFVAWEQFDSSNVEPTVNFLRADIFVAGSEDNGMTWHDPVKLTNGGTASHRFPTIIDMAVDMGGETEEVWVNYLIDQVAGFFVQEENPEPSDNPIIVHRVPVDEIIPAGVAEPGVERTPRCVELDATPNPFGGRTVIDYALPVAGAVSLTVYDAAGRPVRTLEQGVRDAGRYSVAWDGRNDGGETVAAGIYFYTLETDDTSATEKLIVVH